MTAYEQARADHEYLWTAYGEAYDISGGYVDQDDLRMLLRNPTRQTATKCYVNQICYWFEVGTQDDHEPEIGTTHREDARYDPMAREIAERYGCTI